MNKLRSKSLLIFCILCLVGTSVSADTLFHRVKRQMGGGGLAPPPVDMQTTPAVSVDTPAVSADTPFAPTWSPPDGSMPSGSPPDGSMPSGSPPDGSMPSGSPPDGSMPSGSPPDGSMPSGSPPDGSAPSGSPPSDSASPDGSATSPSTSDSTTVGENYPMPTENPDDLDYPVDPDMPPKQRKDRKKRKMNCKMQNFKKLNKCCKAPAANFFGTDEISKCNRRKSAKLTTLVTDYVLNQYQDIDLNNTIDFEDPDTKEELTAGACFAECLFDKQELLQPSGALNKPLVKKYFINKAGESWTSKINTAVDDCRAKAAVFPIFSLTKQSTYRTTKCSLRPLLVLQCVKAQLIKNCPTSSFDSTSTTCTKSLRALDTKCNVMQVLSMKKA